MYEMIQRNATSLHVRLQSAAISKYFSNFSTAKQTPKSLQINTNLFAHLEKVIISKMIIFRYNSRDLRSTIN